MMDDDEYDYSNLNGDWSQTFDDMDGADWAYHMGGPDDDEIEQYYESIAQTYEYDEDDLYDYSYQEEQEVEKDDGGNEYITRMEEIVGWLADSKLAIKFRNKEGFFVPKGPHVRLQDGSIVDLLKWLSKEGIRGGSSVAGYSVVYTPPESEYGERLSFFKIIIDAPFMPISDDNNEEEFDDDDIPF